MFFNQSTRGAARVSWRMQVCFEYARTASEIEIEITNRYCTTRSSTFTFIYCIHFEIAQFDCLNTGFLSEPILFSSSLSEGKKIRCKIWHLLGGFDCLARGTISSDQYKLTKIFIFRAGWRPWQVELLLDIITAVQTFCPWRHFRLAYAML